jgi:NAD(P)H-dependent FMN reductase
MPVILLAAAFVGPGPLALCRYAKIPERVSALKEAIVAGDGLLLATAEYNNAMPGV